MNKIISLTIIFILFTTVILTAQEKKEKNIELSGFVTDYGNKPIKGVRIFIDSLKTKVKTNKKGFYKVIVSNKNKLITAFSVKHGLIDIDYSGQGKINFIFPKNNIILTKKEFENIGYGSLRYGGNYPDYSSYVDIFQLLKTKFQNVQVNGEIIRLKGVGRNLSGNTFAPLFLVNGSQVINISSISPTDIKSISVERSTTSTYGSRGAGGVIKIILK